MAHGDSETPGNLFPMEEAGQLNLEGVDRRSPGWARAISGIFAVLIGLCWLAAALSALFFQSLVAEQGELGLAPVLLAIVAVPILGAIGLDYAHARAMAGFRSERRKTFVRVQGWMGLIVALAFGLVHPLLLFPVLVAGLLGVAVFWLLSRFGGRESAWDFRPAEAVPVLAGRDLEGLRLARTDFDEHTLAGAVQTSLTWLSVAASLAAGSWLSATGVLEPAAVAAIGLITFGAAGSALKALRTMRSASAGADAPARVLRHELDEPDEIEAGGLLVSALDLSVGAQKLLSDVSFAVPAGSITGLVGDSGAGKSMLLQVLADPFSIAMAEVRGHVSVHGDDLWQRGRGPRRVTAVYLPPAPLVLPASGEDNLACFHDSTAKARGRQILEKLVFSADLVDRICDGPADLLPDMQKKSLALARALLLAPDVYLLDRPEDGLHDRQITALQERLRHEVRLGRSVVIVSQNRGLMEMCDRLIVMQAGRVVDFGEAAETRARLDNGWSRLVAARSLDTEDNLESWVRGHFRRRGDEANRRKVCLVASELLAFSCQSANAMGKENLAFEFKHFEGHCILRLEDGGVPVSSAQLQNARRQLAKGERNARKSPLAVVLRESIEIEVSSQLDKRQLTVRIATYDPRKSAAQGAGQDAARQG